MSTVDNRVVHMTFDNAKFERDIATSIKSLGELRKAMDFTNAKKGLEDLSKTSFTPKLDMRAFNNSLSESFRGVQKLQDNLNFGATSKSLGDFSQQVKGFSLAPMTNGIAGVSKKFLALATIGITALAQIASQAVRTGIDMVTSLTTDPIAGGFREMETNMNSIQTILANTASKGTTLDQVNAALDQLNEYSDKTIYNFSQMAKNIGTFTAAGVDLNTSVNAIKGIANLAAISGSSADQASTAMYQLSQALATGTVKLIDWNSVVNAGMGGEVFKSALFETGKALGKLGDIPMDMTFEQWEKAGNKFRDSLESGWLTSDVLTTTLQAFTGDLSEAQLVSLGYTKEQAAEMKKLGDLGNAAATEVKTLTQLLGTVKEAIGTGWADSFKIIFGDFNEAKATFTDFNNIIGKWVAKSADARNKVLGDWKALGGRTLLIEKIKDLFSNLSKIIDQVQFAFHDIVPRMTGQRLYDLTEKFGNFVDKLALGKEGLDRVARYASAFFTAFHIGFEIIKRFSEMIGDLFKHFAGGGLGDKTIGWFDTLARVIQGLFRSLVTGGGIDAFFDNLTEKLISFGDEVVAIFNAIKDNPLGGLKDLFGQIFSSLFTGDFHGGPLSEDSPVVSFIFKIRDKIKDGIGQVMDILGGFGDKINGWLGTNIDFHIPQGLIDFFKSFKENVDDNTSNSLAGGFDRVKGALDHMWDVLQKVWDILGKIKDLFSGLWDVVKKLGDIAGNVFGAIWDVIKNIGPALNDFIMSDTFDKLLDLMDSLGVLLGGAGLASFGKNNANFGANFGANAFSNFDPLGLKKGADALTKGGGLIDVFKKNMDELSGTLQSLQTAVKAKALLQIAEALALLTASVLVLSFINPESLAKSLTALAVGMSQLIGAVALLNLSSGKGGITPGLGLLSITTAMNAIATSMVILAGALAILARLNPTDLANGLLALETLIIEMATAALMLKGSGANLIAAGVGMIAIAGALVILSGAIKVFATMSWEEIGKGLAAVGGGLLIIAGAMQLMPVSTLLIGPGLVAVAFAMDLLGAAMVIFATMSWEEIGKGLTVLGGGLLLIAAALNLMPLTSILSGPALIAVATALGILSGVLLIFATMSWEEIGKSMTVLGGSMLILAGGLALMQGAIPGAIAVGIAAASLLLFSKVINAFADMDMKKFAKGLGLVAVSLLALGAAALILEPTILPLMGLALALALLGGAFALVGVGAALLAEAFQVIAAAGTAGVDVFMYALDSFVDRVPKLIDIFIQNILNTITTILSALPAMVEQLSGIISALFDLILENMPGAIVIVTKFIQGILQTIRDTSPDFVRTGFKLLQDLLHGLEDNITEITDTVAVIITRFIRELTRHIPDLVDAAVDMLVAFVTEMSKHVDELAAAALGWIIAVAEGITNNVDELVDAAADILVDFIAALGDAAEDLAAAGLKVILDLISGIAKNMIMIVTQGTLALIAFISGLADNTLLLTNAALDIVVDFINGLADAIENHDDELRDAALHLGWAIVDGMSLGIAGKAKGLLGGLKDLGTKGVTTIAQPWKWGSPSKTMIEMGEDIVLGLAIGLSHDNPMTKSANDLSESAIEQFRDSLSRISEAVTGMDEFQPTITPVLDLTNVKTTAGQLSSLLATNPISAGVSVDQATTLANADAQARQDAAVIPETTPEIRSIKFEQNNYSPEPLTPKKVYKQTSSQIELAKKELEKV